MAIRSKIDMDPVDSSTTRYASNATGATFTLAQTTPGDGLARTVLITNDDARDDTLITITIVGTDADGKAQTEAALTGPDASTTTESTKHFLTVTSVTPVSTIGANTWDIGIGDKISSKTIPLNSLSDVPAVAAVDVTGTIGFDIEVTYDLVNSPDFTWTDQSSAAWLNATNLTAKTADIIGEIDRGAQAARVLINSYTDTAELQFWITQTESH